MVRFWHTIRLVFQERMAYRANLFLDVFGGIIASVIVVVLWSAIYKGAGAELEPAIAGGAGETSVGQRCGADLETVWGVP